MRGMLYFQGLSVCPNSRRIQLKREFNDFMGHSHMQVNEFNELRMSDIWRPELRILYVCNMTDVLW